MGRTAEESCDDILAVLQGDLTDDVALLVCDYAGPVEGRAAAAITLPSDLSAIGDGRAFVTATLERWGLGRLGDTVSLLASELVTNALVHTDGPATLELRRDGGMVRLRVTDADTRPPQLRERDRTRPRVRRRSRDGPRAGAFLRVGRRAVRLGQDRLGGRGPHALSGRHRNLSSGSCRPTAVRAAITSMVDVRLVAAVSPRAPRRTPGRPMLRPGRGRSRRSRCRVPRCAALRSRRERRSVARAHLAPSVSGGGAPWLPHGGTASHRREPALPGSPLLLAQRAGHRG